MCAQLRILIVDDDPLMAMTLVDIIRVKGYDAESVQTGYDALKQLAERRFDCVLTDVKMPGISGVELFQELKPIQPGLPVVFMTAYSASDLVQQGLDEGAIAILTKPVNIDLLLEFLDALRGHPSIIVASNDLEFYKRMANILRMQGYDVSQARDAEHVAQQLAPRDQVILLDATLNGADSIDLLSALADEHPVLPPILLTGERGELEPIEERASSLGVGACLHRPVDPERLLQLLAQMRLKELRRLLHQDER
jgi:two-component system response regulator HydG